MAKVPFSKLKLTKKEDIKTITINEIEIDVKQYLPIAEKLNLIANVLNNSADENNFENPVKVDVIGHLEIIYAYTNLSFTEKQKEDVSKLYDLLENNGVIDKIVNAIPEEEYNYIIDSIEEVIASYYKQQNSALGIMERISADYKDMDFNATQIQEKIADPNNLTLLKTVMNELG